MKKYLLIIPMLLFCEGVVYAYDNPIPWAKTIADVIMRILDGMLYLAGGVFVLLIVIAGIRLMGSFGNPAKLNDTKNTLWYCSLGLITLLASKAILNFVIDVLEISK
ncbi:hypothetical protein [Minisyncoccus archaeiphilus]|uniref:hypothetical protein n=1 Tax=Minisyncoccus archaeiphilus TaxID=3238481 RepID=UPI00399C7B70